ncbi:GNAT family N-acetyltransferase [Pelagicoccus sp. SDUM812005]|uniref:GNAT family N-acetyltransferase n=1 Tax=Pelagicoccus sp. SDUM812005 TaxID=3041257 RepID=UPI00280DE228|nr:GNAT family N-acetyltransferase [Pelagicoccus sp. SDUM812005]MDQ8183417.1 GNAT family N-acetyltransferase [Pelagicoccus sp. SDUM812005]
MKKKMITIRRVKLGEWNLYREVRLGSLKEAPCAFSTKFEVALERSDKSWKRQADDASEGDAQAIFIAFSDGKPSGIAAIYRDKEKMEDAEVFQVWVCSKQRGAGLGTKIMDTVFEWAEQVGCRRVFASIAETNKKALGFYSRYGFVKVSEVDGETKMEKRTRSNKKPATSTSDSRLS